MIRRRLLATVCWLWWPALAAAQPRSFDVVVYGGTAGGVVTAIAAAREGARVALLEPRDHLGGMVSGGLGWTDFGKKEVIGGYALVAYPAEYGNSGVMTFLVNHQRVIYEKDLGPNTSRIASGITAFNPDSSWQRVDDAAFKD